MSGVLNHNLISFPDDFDPAAPAGSGDGPASEHSQLVPLPALPLLLPDITGAADTPTLVPGIPAAAALNTLVDAAAIAQSATPTHAVTADTAPPQPLLSAAMPPPTTQRSLRRQTSTSFSALTGKAGSSASKGPRDRAEDAAVPTRPSSPSLLAVYNELHLTPAPIGAETAGANRARHGENERAIAQALLNLKHDVASFERIGKMRHEEVTLMLTDTRINAASEASQVAAAQMAELHSSLVSTRNSLAETITAVNGLKRMRTDVDAICAAIAVGPAARAPAPASSAVHALPTAIGVPLPTVLHDMPAPGAAAATVTIPARRAADDDVLPAAKRQRTGDAAYDVWFYDVHPTNEARDIARTAVLRVPGLSGSCFSNAIRVRNRSATISIRFRSHPFALAFIHAIEHEPPTGLEGMHACWAPATADPISLIRGEAFSGRSSG
ncbi:hypothetical protein B0H11DRAFT_2214694 [Mycena galericulata]|nr:hypothetical protein B0H11DRAFT_2214694 [Mycena galericulata]